MDIVNLRVRYRPMRIGLCIEEGNPDAFRAAVRINTTLWGGRFNPIIPIGASTETAKHLVSTFQVDALQDISTTKAVTDFIESLPHLKWPAYNKALFLPREGGTDAALLDVYHPVRQIAQRPPAQVDKQFQAFLLQWSQADFLRDVLMVSYGEYPSKDLIGKDYLALFKRLKPAEVFVDIAPVPSEAAEMLSPLAVTTLELSPGIDPATGFLSPSVRNGLRHDHAALEVYAPKFMRQSLCAKFMRQTGVVLLKSASAVWRINSRLDEWTRVWRTNFARDDFGDCASDA